MNVPENVSKDNFVKLREQYDVSGFALTVVFHNRNQEYRSKSFYITGGISNIDAFIEEKRKYLSLSNQFLCFIYIQSKHFLNFDQEHINYISNHPLILLDSQC